MTKVNVRVPPTAPPKISERFNLIRLFESLVPTVIVGLVVVYANFRVMQYQVDDIRKELDRAAVVDAGRQVQFREESDKRQTQLREQSEKLVGISAQMSSYLAQQTTLNAQMDARLTYVERARTR